MKRLKKGVIDSTDISMGLVIFVSFLALIIIPMMKNYLDMQSIQNAAGQAKRIQKAAQLYISDKSDYIIANATSSKSVNFGVTDLINAGYLPPGYSTKNIFSATYQTRVFQPEAKKLNSMTYLTGGAELTPSLRLKLASAIGASAGVITNGVAKGAQGAWVQNLSNFGGYNPGEGTVVIAGFYNNGSVINDYLYRKALPGHPELNTMSTALNMGGNDVNNAKVINNQTTNTSGNTITSGSTTTGGDTNTGGWFRTKGDGGWINDKHQGGFTMTDDGWVRSVYDKGIYTGGQVQAGTIQSNGRMTTNEFVQINGVATAGWACSPNGLVGRDASGGILSCQSGVWTSSGKVSSFEVVQGNDACGKYVYSKAYCPAGKQLISGGFVLSNWTGGNGWNAPDASMPSPSENAWQLVTGGGVTGGTCMRAIAWCAKN